MVKKFCGNIKNLFVMELLFKFIDSLSSHQVTIVSLAIQPKFCLNLSVFPFFFSGWLTRS